MHTHESKAKFGAASRHIFVDNGASVLGVAHLDSVAGPNHFWMNSEYIASPTIDNRLGAWIITHLLGQRGVKIDILLTEGEEKGQSTSVDFKPPTDKKYNWMFSFDRTGMDVACYQYLGKELKMALTPYGLVATNGSYSDIASLDKLGCRGMNFGCAMYNYHGEQAHSVIRELKVMIAAFLCFYEDNKDIHFPFQPAPQKVFSFGTSRSEWYYGAEGGDYYTEGYGSLKGRRTYNQKAWEVNAEGEAKEVKKVVGADEARCQKIYSLLFAEGMGNSFFEGFGPATWWLLNQKHTPKQTGKDWTMTCKRCQRLFHHDDTIYSNSVTKTLCKYCFLETMSILHYIPHDWREHALREDDKETVHDIARKFVADFSDM